MIEPLLRRFLDYEKRNVAVIIGTILVGVAVLWPATDEYIAARQRTHDAQLNRDQAEQAIAKLPQFTRLHETKGKELKVLTDQLVGADAARKLQNDLMELGRQTGCIVLGAQLTEPTSRVWTENDNPLLGARSKSQGVETPFQLETRQLTLSISGPMEGLCEFLEGLHRVNKVMHARGMAIKGGNSGGGKDKDNGTLDMNLLLFDLTKRVAVAS